MPNNPTPAAMAETLKAVVNTLNLVDVRGKQNMDKQLASIITLEKLVAELESKKEENV